MNYLTEARRHALAAEYALGTLQGKARIRFQGLMMQHPELRHTLWHWESYLNELGAALPEQAPHPRVWEKVKSRIGFESTNNNVVPLTQKAPVLRWQWLAGLSSAAALLLVAVLIWPVFQAAPEQPRELAVVQSEQGQPLWLIELQADLVQVQATERLQPRADRDYELWLVAADGRDPVSLGLLPKQGKKSLPRIDLMDQVEIAALAVSLEPLGGSPTGQPTEVLYAVQTVIL